MREGSFGVVTALTFAPTVAPAMTSFHLTWSWRAAAGLIEAWQHWAPTAPDGLSADLVLGASAAPGSEPTVEMFGALLGDGGALEDLLRGLVGAVGAPTAQLVRELDYLETCRHQADVSVGHDLREPQPDGQVRLRQGWRYTKSGLFAKPLAGDAVKRLLDVFTGTRRAGEIRSVGFAPLGGAYNRRDRDETAFFHRDQLFSTEHLVVVPPTAADDAKRSARRWIEDSWSSVHEGASGYAYQCFPDPDLADWSRAHYGDNLHRLRLVKAQYDPENVFKFAQSIEPLATFR